MEFEKNIYLPPFKRNEKKWYNTVSFEWSQENNLSEISWLSKWINEKAYNGSFTKKVDESRKNDIQPVIIVAKILALIYLVLREVYSF